MQQFICEYIILEVKLMFNRCHCSHVHCAQLIAYVLDTQINEFVVFALADGVHVLTLFVHVF